MSLGTYPWAARAWYRACPGVGRMKGLHFFGALANYRSEVERCWRTFLRSRAEGLAQNPRPNSRRWLNVHSTLALV